MAACSTVQIHKERNKNVGQGSGTQVSGTLLMTQLFHFYTNVCGRY
jgi:hypothetical protein